MASAALPVSAPSLADLLAHITARNPGLDTHNISDEDRAVHGDEVISMPIWCFEYNSRGHHEHISCAPKILPI